jgi:hypothetical protein
MPENQLTAEQASAVVGVLRGVANINDETLQIALGKLTALTGELPPGPRTRFVGLVTLNTSGVPEVVCGKVALVDFSNLTDPSHTPDSLEEQADKLACDLGESAARAVSELRALAHERRVQRLQIDGDTGCCTLPALLAAIAAAEIDPRQVMLHGAHVESQQP